MSAVKLRQAADKIRAAVDAVEAPAPWLAFRHVQHRDESIVTFGEDLPVALCAEGHEPEFTDADAAYIAMMDPDTGAAVAALLDAIAVRAQDITETLAPGSARAEFIIRETVTGYIEACRVADVVLEKR